MVRVGGGGRPDDWRYDGVARGASSYGAAVKLTTRSQLHGSGKTDSIPDSRCFCGSLKRVFANPSLLSVETCPNVLLDVRPDAPALLAPLPGGAGGGPLPFEGALLNSDAKLPALPIRPLPAACQAGALEDAAGGETGDRAGAPGAGSLADGLLIWLMRWFLAALPAAEMAVLGMAMLVWVDDRAGGAAAAGADDPPPGRLWGRDSKYLDNKQRHKKQSAVCRRCVSCRKSGLGSCRTAKMGSEGGMYSSRLERGEQAEQQESKSQFYPSTRTALRRRY